MSVWECVCVCCGGVVVNSNNLYVSFVRNFDFFFWLESVLEFGGELEGEGWVCFVNCVNGLYIFGVLWVFDKCLNGGDVMVM